MGFIVREFSVVNRSAARTEAASDCKACAKPPLQRPCEARARRTSYSLVDTKLLSVFLSQLGILPFWFKLNLNQKGSIPNWLLHLSACFVFRAKAPSYSASDLWFVYMINQMTAR